MRRGVLMVRRRPRGGVVQVHDATNEVALSRENASALPPNHIRCERVLVESESESEEWDGVEGRNVPDSGQ